jgi:radical SAM protein with 4Fe4S-binding SPASM domain
MMKVDHRPIDLIIKPTESCNFACTFCSSSYLVENKSDQLELKYIFDFLKKFPNTQTIIVNGGDPQMMPPKFYWDIIHHLEEYQYDANISLTTNLWKFWREWETNAKDKPWTELFSHPKMNVTTSFQYGEARRITKDRIFTEEDFIKISDLMLEKIGYRPSFISVIENDNLETSIENVRLAKKLGVDCKLNYANKSGSCGSPLPLSRIYRVYLDIIKEGLADYEWNTRQMVNRLERIDQTVCPLNRDCDSGIRVLQPDGKYYTCGAFGDDRQFEINYEQEVYGDHFFTPLADSAELHSLKNECYTCPMFQICNGCKKHISDLKETNLVESHCREMKKIAEEIEYYNLNFNIEIFNEIHEIERFIHS